MLRTHHAFWALAPVLALGYVACVGEPMPEGQEIIPEEESAIIVPGKDIVGTFRNQKLQVGALALLVLKSDSTYHSGRVIACITTPCDPVQEDGHYSLWTRDGATYMSLYPEDGGAVERYRYILGRDTIRLGYLGQRTWMTLVKTDGAAWCGEPVDCSLQYLPVGPCASEWNCVTNLCSYSCRPPYPEE